MNRTTSAWKKSLLVGIAVVVLALAVVMTNIWSTRQANTFAPDVDFTLTDGSQLSLEALRGKPVLVLFWATTCKICIAKTPEMNRFYKNLHPKGLQMIAVAMPYDPPTRVVEFEKKLEMPYPVALDHEATIVRAFGNVKVTPTTFLIGPDGTIAWRKTGKLDMNTLDVTIRQMLEKPESML
jgi:peroxiredoxin